MTIASAIETKQQQVAAAYSACNNKGATIPATQDLTNLATCINSISSGVEPTRFKDDSNNEIGTYIMDFTDASNNTYKVIILDAQYRASSKAWGAGNNAVTNLPLYELLTTSNIWEAKETATFNTQTIVNYCNANSVVSAAVSHCRSLSFVINGTTYYGQFPNMNELYEIGRLYNTIERMDTSASSYSNLNFSANRIIWSSSQLTGNGAWTLFNNCATGSKFKADSAFVCPVLEIPK